MICRYDTIAFLRVGMDRYSEADVLPRKLGFGRIGGGVGCFVGEV